MRNYKKQSDLLVRNARANYNWICSNLKDISVEFQNVRFYLLFLVCYFSGRSETRRFNASYCQFFGGEPPYMSAVFLTGAYESLEARLRLSAA